jgi:hypothetical protein
MKKENKYETELRRWVNKKYPEKPAKERKRMLKNIIAYHMRQGVPTKKPEQ